MIDFNDISKHDVNDIVLDHMINYRLFVLFATIDHPIIDKTFLKPRFINFHQQLVDSVLELIVIRDRLIIQPAIL